VSERDNMMNSGYRRYWGCGNLVFEYIIKYWQIIFCINRLIIEELI
jgi:hypothetical protein